MFDLISSEFPRRYEASFAWKSACSAHLFLPGVRGFWPTSAFDTSGNLVDQSGQGNNLTYNGNPMYRRAKLAPIVVLDGTGDYFSHAGGIGSWCDILGSESYVNASRRGVTIGGWFQFTNAAGSSEYMISKWDIAGNERSYTLIRWSTGVIRFGVSDDGTAVDNVDTVGTPAADEWFWAAGRYDDATEEIDVWYNDENVNAALVGWGGTIRSNATDFLIGGYHGGLSLMTGWASLCFCCAQSVPDSILFSVREQTRALFGV